MTTDSSELQQTLRLKPEQLTVPIDLANMGFTTTDDLEPFRGILGQERAVEAVWGCHASPRV